MYPGFMGTVVSHILSLLSTIWAIFNVRRCNPHTPESNYIHLALILVATNSSLALVRYGSYNGYKLRRLHIVMLNVSAIMYFTIVEGVFLINIRSSPLSFILPVLNVFPLLTNSLASDYRTKHKRADVFILINSLFLLLTSFLNDNYNGMAFSLSYFFGYFYIGESGYFLDTEVPSVDAFQYLMCFLNYFAVNTLCY